MASRFIRATSLCSQDFAKCQNRCDRQHNGGDWICQLQQQHTRRKRCMHNSAGKKTSGSLTSGITHLVDEQGQCLHAGHKCSPILLMLAAVTGLHYDASTARRSIFQRTSIAAALHRSRVTSSRCCFLTRGMIRCACHFSFSVPLRINTCQSMQQASISGAADFQWSITEHNIEVTCTSRSTASMLICAKQQNDQRTHESAGQCRTMSSKR
jgi:hypothetical protein